MSKFLLFLKNRGLWVAFEEETVSHFLYCGFPFSLFCSWFSSFKTLNPIAFLHLCSWFCFHYDRNIQIYISCVLCFFSLFFFINYWSSKILNILLPNKSIQMIYISRWHILWPVNDWKQEKNHNMSLFFFCPLLNAKVIRYSKAVHKTTEKMYRDALHNIF